MLLVIPSGRQPSDNFGEGNFTTPQGVQGMRAAVQSPPRKGIWTEERAALPPHAPNAGVFAPQLLMTDDTDFIRHELTFAPGKACIVCGKETFFGQSYEVKMRVQGDWKTLFHALYPLCPDHAAFQPLRQGVAKRPLLAIAAFTR